MIWLYVKRHKVTGLRYFGKTTKDPLKYNGSGKYWKRHLEKHGNLIETVKLWNFEDQNSCSKFALQFSVDNNIVESEDWANLQNENGLDGWTAGNPRVSRTRRSDLGTKRKPYSYTPEGLAKMKRPQTFEHKRKRSEALKNHYQNCVTNKYA